AIVAFDRLPFLKVGVFAGGQSSFDRSGGNDDGYATGSPEKNFLGIDAAGHFIMFDLKGAGPEYRIWFTGYKPDAAIMYVYVDDTVAFTKKLGDLFAPRGPGTETKLIRYEKGGSYCYMPIPFSKSIRITTNAAVAERSAFYYNIGYHRYAADTP